ncbi:MAG: hypothetical protein AB7U61_10285 [Methylocystis sp.]
MRVRDIILLFGFISCLMGPAWADKVSVLTSYNCYYLNQALADKNGHDQYVILYVAGYLSGRAVESANDYLNGVPFQSIEEEVKSECRLRPDDMIIEVAGRIADRLRGK